MAHRVVHGGERFTEATLITDEVLGQIEELNPLAPLHNPVNVAGIRQTRRLFPAVPHVAVFDTAFHHTLPTYAYLYGLPYELYEKKGVRGLAFMARRTPTSACAPHSFSVAARTNSKS